MKSSKRTNQVLWAAAMAVGVGGIAGHASAQTSTNTYGFNANDLTSIETSGPYTSSGVGPSYIDINGAGEKYTNYNVIQFSTAGGQFANSLATAVSPNFTLDLTDNGYSGETTEATNLNFFLVDDTTTDINDDGASPLKYETPAALGGGLAAPGTTGSFAAGSNIYYLGSYAWQGAGGGGAEAIPLSLTNATSYPAGSQNVSNAESYLLKQVQNSGTLRLIVTSTNTDSTYVSYDGYASASPPQLNLSVTALTPQANNSVISLTNPPAGATANNVPNINLGRVIESYASFTSTLTVGNSASASGGALVLTSPNNGLDGSSAPSTPIAPGGTGQIVVGFSSADTSGYTAGYTATGNLTYTDANNTSSIISVAASALVVDQRKITAGGTGNATTAAISAGKILVGATGSVAVTLATTNTNTNLPLGNDEGPDVLTTETLAAGAQSQAYTVDDPITSAPVGTISATANSTFVFNSATADTNGVTGYVTPSISGVYGDAHSAPNGNSTAYFNGNYTSFSKSYGLSNDGTTAGESDYADVYLQWQGYQAASVSSSTATVAPNSTALVTLTNAATNDNTDTTNGLRAAAYITGTTIQQTWSSGGWSVQSGFTTGTEINGSQTLGDTSSYSVNGTVGFTQSSQMLNGTYSNAIQVGLQNDQTIQGTHANDLAPVTLNVSATVSSNPSVQSGTYTLNGGTFSAPATNLTGSFTQSGGTATFASITGSGKVTISGGTASLAVGGGASTVSSLSISGNGTLDIGNNHLFINYGAGSDPIASIAAMLKTGYASGAWNGVGIDSATAAANSGSYGIGFADSADPGNPAGLPTGTIEVKYTLLGDANLDGSVNSIDFAILATNFNKAVTGSSGWDQGDFNYDGSINSIDFAALAGNFNKGASQADLAALESFAAANGLLADVPEPASMALFATAGMALLARRNRRAGSK